MEPLKFRYRIYGKDLGQDGPAMNTLRFAHPTGLLPGDCHSPGPLCLEHPIAFVSSQAGEWGGSYLEGGGYGFAHHPWRQRARAGEICYPTRFLSRC